MCLTIASGVLHLCMVHNPLASRTVRCEQCEAARAVRCEPCEDARAVRCEQCEDAFKDTELDERIQRYGDTNHTHDGTQRYTMAGRETVQDERAQRYFFPLARYSRKAIPITPTMAFKDTVQDGRTQRYGDRSSPQSAGKQHHFCIRVCTGHQEL